MWFWRKKQHKPWTTRKTNGMTFTGLAEQEKFVEFINKIYNKNSDHVTRGRKSP